MTRGETPTPTPPTLPRKRGRGSALPSRLLLHQRTAAVLLGPERILSGNGSDHLQQIPFRLRLFRLLHLKQIERMDLASVGADIAFSEQRIVGRQRLHGGDDRLAVGGTADLVDGLEVMNDGSIDAGLHV